MRAWQRLVAALLLIIFVPANVVSALPFVYCLGPGEHSALELIPAGPHHIIDNQQLGAGAAAVLDHSSVAVDLNRDCIDITISLTTQVSQRAPGSDKTFVASSGASPTAYDLTGAPDRFPEAGLRRPIGRNGRLAGNDQLAALRTIVLLN